MDSFEALVGLNMACDIGSRRLKKLLEYFKRPENVFKGAREELISLCGIGEKTADKILSLKEKDVGREILLAKKLKLRILTLQDEEYPRNLKYIPDPPIVLYVKGSLKEEDNLSLAVVGSRRASFYGLSCAQRFARELASRGLTIVSGMAKGVDTYAHRGALKYGGRTIAVMGSGFNHIYPCENKGLAEEIAGNGAVVSEFSVDEHPSSQNFPRRNRIISGLSLGVLVAEASCNSGALITAGFALEQGREVFALPGKIESASSYGTNNLIKEGAKLVSCVEDIMEELPYLADADKLSHGKSAPPRGSPGSEGCPDISGAEAELYSLICDQPQCLDELIERSKIGVSTAVNSLFGLQVKKLIRQLPGAQFVRA